MPLPPWPAGAVSNPTEVRHLGVVIHPPASQTAQRGALLDRAAHAVRMLRAVPCDLRKRAILANSFVWGRLAYYLPHLPWPQTAIAAADRLLARAVWGAPHTSVARSTLSLHPTLGGLGLLSPWLARLRARWRFFDYAARDPYLATRHLRLFAPHLPIATVHAGLPPRRPLSPLQWEVVHDVNALHRLVGLDAVASLNRPQISALLVSVTAAVPRPRRDLPSCLSHPSLARAFRAPAPHAARSMYAKLHLDALPVADWLLRRRIISVPEAACRHCLEPSETVSHLFLSCPFFADLRHRFNSDIDPYQLVDLASILFPSFSDRHRYCLLLAYLWTVWSSRCSTTPHRIKWSALLPLYTRRLPPPPDASQV